MGYVLFLDTSGDWRFIAAVVCGFLPQLDFIPHVASYDRHKRKKIIDTILKFIDTNCYGVCVEANIRQNARSIMRRINNKRTAWRLAIRIGLRRLSNHLQHKGFGSIDSVYADNEFQLFISEIQYIFKTKNIMISKNSFIVLSDALAYANLKLRKQLKKYRNITEL